MSEPTLPPVPPAALTKPPRKWLGRKGGWLIVAAGTVLWAGTIAFELLLEPGKELPTNAMVIGAFTVASAFVYTMAYRLRPTDQLGVVRLLLAFMVGGILSVTLAAPIDGVTNILSGGVSGRFSLPSLALAGVIEEFVKIFVVVLMATGLPRLNVRNGLFLGGAVGFGFAAFEDMSYARDTWNAAVADHAAVLGPELLNVVSRDVIGIFGHPLFTALLAAAVFASVRNGRFRLSWRIVLTYLAVAAAHGIFDFTPEFVVRVSRSGSAGNWTQFLVAAIEAVVLSLIWRRVSRRANSDAALVVRLATADDLEFLTYTLVATANWDHDHGVTFDSVKQNPALWHYLDGWPRSDDFGLIALDGARPIGAVWARTLSAKDAGYGFVDDTTPELTLAVIPDARKRHVGRTLLVALIQEAKRRRLTQLSLSVEDGNFAARRLYEKLGFTVAGRTGNSDTMLLRF